ncbi:MAG: DUF1573 domain-containing protein [Spirosoma sp.]|nr:DUF1573 domain-containing protein [Spirosoma sp.]
MQRILFFISLLAVAASVAMIAPSAQFGWVKTTHDFGRIQQGKPVTTEFKFTNKGQLPLIINNAKGSCGCTGVEYPKEPVTPGATGTIKATYNAAALGAFNKSVTVESNAEGGTTTLYMKGQVLKTVTSEQ